VSNGSKIVPRRRGKPQYGNPYIHNCSGERRGSVSAYDGGWGLPLNHVALSGPPTAGRQASDLLSRRMRLATASGWILRVRLHDPRSSRGRVRLKNENTVTFPDDLELSSEADLGPVRRACWVIWRGSGEVGVALD
jgi:hypothetical protein